MALGPTQPLTEMSTRDLPWGKDGRRVGLQPCHFNVPTVRKSWEPQPPGALRAIQACTRISLPFYLLTYP